jgi:hypothetical protein
LSLTSPAEAEPGPVEDTAEPISTPEPRRFQLALVRATGLAQDHLQAELQLRLPELHLLPHEVAGDISGSQRAYLYLEAQREGPTAYRIAVIVSDGRGYYDTVTTGEAASPERVIASTLANLIFSIEQGQAVPDREDASIPPVASAPKQDSAGTTPDQDAAVPREQAPPAPRVEVGLGLGAGLFTAVGPPRHADEHLGFAGVLDLQLRTVSGFFGFVGFRPAGTQVSGLRLTRFRAELGAGYAWRAKRLELATAVGLAVEPWVVSSEQGTEAVTSEAGVSGRPPLLSAALRLSPGYHVALERGSLRGIRVGPRVDIGGGFVLSGGPQVAGLQTQEGQALFRLGGAELYTGLELVLWLGRPS